MAGTVEKSKCQMICLRFTLNCLLNGKIVSCWCLFSFQWHFALMAIVRLLSYVHDSVLHRGIVFCAIECFMEIKVWPIKHSVRLCSIKHSTFL